MYKKFNKRSNGGEQGDEPVAAVVDQDVEKYIKIQTFDSFPTTTHGRKTCLLKVKIKKNKDK